MKQVNVLISTYNGEKYICEQVESILAQTYPNIHIYIRDDGSSDHTLKVLEKYKDNDRITVIAGINMGYGGSFLELLSIAEDGDYWAYCDQDDVWLEQKIESAVHYLEQQDNSKPRMYHSAFYNTDENLNITDTVIIPKRNISFINCITNCFHMGFSDVMNRSLRELVLKGDKTKLITHDWWTELVVMEFGEVYDDDTPLTKHRRLENSVSIGSFSARWRWFKKALKGNAEIETTTRAFMNVFGNEMKVKDKKVLSWFVGDSYSLKKALLKTFYHERWRPSISSELVMRFLMLIGKI